MKKVWSIFLVIAMVLTVAVVPVSADPEYDPREEYYPKSGQCGDSVYWNLNVDTGVLTISGSGDMWDFDDYSYVDGYRTECTSAPWGFYGRSITSIVVQNGVTSIGDYAFYAANFDDYYMLFDGVKSVSLGDSVTDIGEHAFSGCYNMTSIKLSENLKTVWDWAFFGCQKLEKVTLPSSLASVFDGAFSLTGMTQVTIPSSVIYIGPEAFGYNYIFEGGAAPLNGFTIYGESGSEAEHYYQELLSEYQEHLDTVNEWGPGYYNENFNNNCTIRFIPIKDEPSSWAVEEVNAAIKAGLVPEELQKDYTNPVSRAKVARMFINLIEKSSGKSIDKVMKEKGVKINTAAFDDTTDQAVLAANALGIINGVGNNKFDPSGTFTRSQIATIINRVAKVMGVETEGYTHSFTDVNGHWVSSELGWPVHAGIINGVGNNKFDPNGPLTTEQAIAITSRGLQALKAEL